MLIAGIAALAQAGAALAADPENCVSCHRYRGLARMGDAGDEVRLFYVDPNYYDRALGPHARLRCTDCHERGEVGVIPHQPVSAVNCTKTCHITDPRGPETHFSHDRIAGMLEASVHTREVLSRSNELLGRPLHENASQCLLCHDEPVFRRADESWVAHATPVGRCTVCHEGAMEIDADFMYWHVHARSRQARSNADITRVCAVCHSDEQIKREFKLPDATASYLASFHGKAMQLGSVETAGCLDCHAGELQNVHLMRKHADPLASTHKTQLPDTCRSPACHPTAGVRVSTAAVHLELAGGYGIEYFIGAVFVLLILFTFGPSLLLTALEMLQIVVGRHDPKHHERVHLARRLLADDRGRRALKRFTPHQRVQHWLLFVCFTLLVLTGFPIKFADRGWAQWLIDLFGGLSAARLIHRYAGLILLIGMFYHLAYVAVFLWRQQRATGKSFIRVFLDLPLIMTLDDARHMGQLLAYLLFLRKTRPEAGRFSAEEKFEYFGVFWGTMLLGLTGLLMWANAWTSEHLTGRVLTVALIVHTFEAFLALLHVGVIHLIGVIFGPGVFPLSRAMFTGDTPAEELAEAHGAMLTAAARQIGLAEGGHHD
jgi:formate dehydrogenase gamma subunit